MTDNLNFLLLYRSYKVVKPGGIVQYFDLYKMDKTPLKQKDGSSSSSKGHAGGNSRSPQKNRSASVDTFSKAAESLKDKATREYLGNADSSQTKVSTQKLQLKGGIKKDSSNPDQRPKISFNLKQMPESRVSQEHDSINNSEDDDKQNSTGRKSSISSNSEDTKQGPQKLKLPSSDSDSGNKGPFIPEPIPLFDGKAQDEPNLLAGFRRVTRIFRNGIPNPADGDASWCPHVDVADWKCKDCNIRVPQFDCIFDDYQG